MRNSGAASAPTCPICQHSSERGATLTRARLVKALEEFVGSAPDAAVSIRDYTMCRCPACELEFAEPMAPADDAFYTWLDRTTRYYLSERWEWDRVQQQVAGAGVAPSVLEIGAGDGRLLRRLRDAGARTVGIERSDAAVRKLAADGIEAHTPEQARTALAGRQFDFVLAFHCLEHVPDPLGLLETMRNYAGAKGRVLLSVPYSPMYFERHWFDPLNHPPHHLSRWNARSLAELAARGGGSARLELPEPYGALARARYSLAIERLGPHWSQRRRWRFLPLLHPVRFAAMLREQLARERVNGRPAADVVLMEFVPKPA